VGYTAPDGIQYLDSYRWTITPNYYNVTNLIGFLDFPTIDTPIIAQQLQPVEEEPFEITDQEDLQIHFAYDSSLNKILVAFNFQFMAGTNTSILIPNYSTIVQKYSDVMGWDYNKINITQYFRSGTAYDLPDQVELLKTKNIYLRTSNILTTNIASQDLQRGTIFARIPLDVEYGSVLYYKSSTSRPSKLESKILKDFRFQLVDDSFNLINLQGCDWQTSFYLSFIYNRSYISQTPLTVN
jgi:hypothetical protein